MDIYEFARQEFEKQYDSLMTVSENQPVKVGSITKSQWIIVEGLKDIPCRIAKESAISPAGEGEFAQASYTTSLYCNPSLNIRVGSRITVTDSHGVSRYYKRASEGFSSYKTHQEVFLLREVTA
ncbi:hypothetical protein QLI93_001603 [Listeria monocytogenes]|uniref:hypothetical protein n=1 Tax=Listeria monocytogenes TaxID=1639 RepID=UPI0010D01BCB|nr:hypothetical protein [Listeria monocytogenes]EAC8001187.1 hypothetical protein [Listeria monocytogenes]EKZ7015246.1 hypothetical protein [Listeria monocytogenes]TYU82173.1 hypothetical protein FZX01_15900 [Listeria monocytogenes]